MQEPLPLPELLYLLRPAPLLAPQAPPERRRPNDDPAMLAPLPVSLFCAGLGGGTAVVAPLSYPLLVPPPPAAPPVPRSAPRAAPRPPRRGRRGGRGGTAGHPSAAPPRTPTWNMTWTCPCRTRSSPPPPASPRCASVPVPPLSAVPCPSRSVEQVGEGGKGTRPIPFSKFSEYTW